MRPNTHFILICFALLISGAFAEEVDRPPVDPQPLPAIELRKPVEQVEPPSVVFDATRNMKTREQIRDEKSRLAKIARNEQIQRKVRAAFDALKGETLTIYKIRGTGEAPKKVSAEKFRQYEVLARSEADMNLEQEWSALILNLKTTGTQDLSCFEPGIALQWKDAEGHKLEALVCLWCLRIRWYIDADEDVSFILGKPDNFTIGAQFLKLFPDEEYAKHLASMRARWEADMKNPASKEVKE